MGQKLTKAPRGDYDAIVYIEGSEIVAEDTNGRKIASGVSGAGNNTVINTALATGRVFLADGLYDMPAALSIVHGDCELFGGPNAIFRRAEHTNAITVYVSQQQNVRLRGFSIDGNIANNPYPAYTEGSNLTVYDSDNVQIESIHSYNGNGDGIEVGYGSTNVQVHNCRCHDNSENDLHVNGAQNVIASNCLFYNNGSYSVAILGGLETKNVVLDKIVEWGAVGGLAIGYPSMPGATHDVIVSNSIFAANTGYGVYIRNQAYNYVIDNCKIINNGLNGIDITTPASDPVSYALISDVISNCDISGNNTIGTSSAGGIAHQASHTSRRGFSLINNRIIGNAKRGIYTSCPYMVVKGGRIAHNTWQAVYLLAGANYFDIEDVEIYNNSAATDGGYEAISSVSSATVTDVTIKNCDIDSNPADAKLHKYAVGIGDAACTGWKILDNRIANVKRAAILSLLGSGHTISGNFGYIGAGEIRTHAGSIATLTQDAFNSVDNPFGQNVALLSLDIYVATGATATSPNIDCGIGSSATTDYTNLFDDLPGESIGLYNSKVATPGTQTQPILWQTGAGNRYLNMSIKDAAATGMVATYVATVMGL